MNRNKVKPIANLYPTTTFERSKQTSNAVTNTIVHIQQSIFSKMIVF